MPELGPAASVHCLAAWGALATGIDRGKDMKIIIENRHRNKRKTGGGGENCCNRDMKA